MRPKSILLLVLALGCGLVASIGISQVMEGRNAGGSNVEQVEVLVAKVEIAIGDPITAEKIKVLAIPKTLVPADAFTSIDEVKDKRPRSKILVDDIIRAGKLSDGEATQVPDGFRVVTIKATADRGANLLKPGDRVDVQVYVRAGAVPQQAQPFLKTFLTDVRVFAVDTKTEAAEEEAGAAAARTVSLLVKPDQSQLVTLASNIGTIQLVMRSSLDKGTGEKGGEMISLKHLFGPGVLSPGDRDEEKTAANPGPETTVKPATPAGSGILDVIRGFAKKSAKPKTPEEHLIATAPSFGHQMIGIGGTTMTRFSFSDPNKPPVETVEMTNNGGNSSQPPSNSPQPVPAADPVSPPADPPATPAPPTGEPTKSS